MSDIIKNAVALTNQSAQEAVERQGQRLISLILGEQASIRSCNGRIVESQKAIKAIADNSVTIASVMGDVRLPSDGNMNTDTIVKSIERANKAAQDSVGIASANLIADITGEQKNITACEARIAEYRKELLALSAEAVSVRDVVGS
jgi:hypothetical protein